MYKQLSVFAENKRGAMNSMTKLLKEAGINITALVTNDSAEFGIVRMIVDEPTKAFDIMNKAGYLCKLDSVIAVDIGDEVGSLDKLLEFITSSYINVDYLYLSFNRETSTPIVILHAPDSDELENFLQSKGYATVK